jgi:hypothetical protein
MRLKKMSARPTNSDLAAAINDLHDCVHAVDKRVDAQKEAHDELKVNVDKMDGQLSLLSRSFGVPVLKPEQAPDDVKTHRPIAAMGQWEAFWKGAAAFLTALAAVATVFYAIMHGTPVPH